MALQVTQISLELIRALRPLMPRLRQRDKSLADQLRRAATSITLNLGEAQYSDPGNRRARLCTAAGSAGETLLALQSAEEWGYLSASQTAAALALCGRVIAILWRMTH